MDWPSFYLSGLIFLSMLGFPEFVKTQLWWLFKGNKTDEKS